MLFFDRWRHTGEEARATPPFGRIEDAYGLATLEAWKLDLDRPPARHRTGINGKCVVSLFALALIATHLISPGYRGCSDATTLELHMRDDLGTPMLRCITGDSVYTFTHRWRHLAEKA